MRLLTQPMIPMLLAAAAAFGQTAARPQFEVASIRPCATAEDQFNLGVHIDGAMVIIRWFSLRDYIGMAYQVKDFQIVGPDWMAGQKFDIHAKIPDGATRSQLPAMMQSLLAERFKLAVHIEKKEAPVYVLSVLKRRAETEGIGG